MKNLTDEELMIQVAEGKLESMRILFERYHVWIYNFFLQMIRNREVCEDLTQNTFYKVIRYKTSYNGNKFSTWIFRIARNLSTDYFRETKNKASQTMDSLPEIAIAGNENEETQYLNEALQKLPDSDREIVVLNKLHGLKYAEIAEVLQSTESAVRLKAHRAIKKLRTIYFESVDI